MEIYRAWVPKVKDMDSAVKLLPAEMKYIGSSDYWHWFINPNMSVNEIVMFEGLLVRHETYKALFVDESLPTRTDCLVSYKMPGGRIDFRESAS